MTQYIHPLDPRYSKTFETDVQREVINPDDMLDDNGDNFTCLITYHWYRDSQGGRFISEYQYRAVTECCISDEDLNESVRGAIRIHAGEPVTFESTKPNF